MAKTTIPPTDVESEEEREAFLILQRKQAREAEVARVAAAEEVAARVPARRRLKAVLTRLEATKAEYDTLWAGVLPPAVRTEHLGREATMFMDGLVTEAQIVTRDLTLDLARCRAELEAVAAPLPADRLAEIVASLPHRERAHDRLGTLRVLGGKLAASLAADRDVLDQLHRWAAAWAASAPPEAAK